MTTTIKKAFTAVVAMVMALVLMVPAGAAYAAGTGSITITPPAGTASETQNTYKIYKVFDADGNGTNISYKLRSGDTLTDAMKGAGFSKDDGGNVTFNGTTLSDGTLNSEAIAAIASYVTEADVVATVSSTGAEDAVARDLDNGYYYITTSTGTAVTINSTNPNATVKDKNTVPSVDKKITKAAAGSVTDEGLNAIAQAGSTVSYESDITVPANTKNLKFADTIVNTQTLDTTSVAIKVNGTAVDASNYTLTTDNNTINIKFVDSYIKTLNNATIVVTYTTTVNSDALSSDPSTNTATITYGDNNAKVTSTITSIYNAKITVTKSFQGLTGTLANNDSAQFVLKNSAGKYYAINSETKVVSWVDSIDNATQLTYTQAGSQDFTGLADGTYTLVESKTPAGYKTAADQTITVANGTYTAANLEQTATVENQTGTALPTTGGMGTTVLYAVGAALVITAGALLIARKRNTQE